MRVSDLRCWASLSKRGKSDMIVKESLFWRLGLPNPLIILRTIHGFYVLRPPVHCVRPLAVHSTKGGHSPDKGRPLLTIQVEVVGKCRCSIIHASSLVCSGAQDQGLEGLGKAPLWVKGSG